MLRHLHSRIRLHLTCLVYEYDALSQAKTDLPDYHCQGVCTHAFVCGNFSSPALSATKVQLRMSVFH